MTRVSITGMAELVHASSTLMHIAVYSSELGNEVRLALNIVALDKDGPNFGNFDERQKAGMLNVSRDEFERFRNGISYPTKPRLPTSLTFDTSRRTNSTISFKCGALLLKAQANTNASFPLPNPVRGDPHQKS